MIETPLDSKDITSKFIRGVFALGGRQVFVHGLNLTGNIMLARLLSPADFGIYAVVVFLIAFLGIFGGTGMASNLIRCHLPPSEEEYASVFSAQQSLLLVLTVIFWGISPGIAQIYRLPQLYVWLFRSAALSLLITSLMVIPQIKLERELSFSKLAIAEVWQAIIFNVSAVLLAWRGWGGMAFAVALLSRSVTGVIVIYSVKPWLPRWCWNWGYIRKNIGFGFFFQLSQVVSLGKDAVTPVLLGVTLGAASVGYTSWASMLASYPVLALMVLQRIYLPAFARLQHEPKTLSRFVGKVIFATNIIAAPLSIFILVLITPITGLIYGAKWYAAIPLFLLFWITNLFAPTATPILGLLNALGYSRMVLGFTILWMIMTWAIGIPLVSCMGAIGLAWANVCVQISNVVLYAVAKRKLQIPILSAMAPSWLLGIMIGMLLWGINYFYPIRTTFELISCFAFGGVFYTAGIMYWHGAEIKAVIMAIRSGRATV